MAESTDGGRDRAASEASDDKQWVKVQKQTFTNWVNDRLKDTGLKVEDLRYQFDDGITLVKLLEVLAHNKKMPKYKKNPKLPLHKQENLSIVFKFMKDDEKIELVNIGPGDILEHNLKLVLGLVWTLIQRYQLGIGAQRDDSDSKDGKKTTKPKKKPSASAKKLLLGWMNATLPGMGIRNLTTDWNDGIKLSALVDSMKPGLIPDHATLNPNNALPNTRNAMNLAEEHFGIPQIIEPENLCVPQPDELSVMTYLGYYCNKESPGKNSLLDWIHEKIPHRNITNFTSDWKDGVSLGCLTDVVSGGQFPDYEDMKPNDPLGNATKSMDYAETLGVPKSITPEEFIDPALDPLPLMTYLTNFKFATPSGNPLAGISAAGPGITGDKCQKETNFVIRGRIPDWAPLDITITAPDGSKVNHQRMQTVATSSAIKYVPPIPGTYVVEVKVNNEHIRGSPFTAHHSEPSNAKGCLASGSGLDKALVGEKAEILVDCSSGGNGTLQVEVTGPTGRIGTEIIEESDHVYEVKLTPLEAGPHIVAINWSGNHINGSPFNVNAVDPKKVTTSGSGLTSAIVNEPATFKVQTKGAGQGVLDVDITGPNGESIPVNKREDSPDEHTCTFVPPAKGNYSIKLSWAGFPVGSPFRVAATIPANASKCKVRDIPTGYLRAGKEAKFIVNTSEAGDAELHAKGQGASLPQDCSIRPIESGLYEVSFTPFEVGNLDIRASYGKDEIPEMPLSFAVNDPTKCHVNAAAIEKGSYSLQEPISFRVSAQYAGKGDLTAKLHGPEGEKEPEIKETGDGTYQIQFEPNAPGPHAINIFFDGEQIPNGLVRLFVEAGTGADDVIVTQPAPSKLGVFLVDTRYEYKINASGAKAGKLAATGSGIRTGNKPTVEVVEHGDGQYSVNVSTEVPDEYHFTITWGGDSVPGSPFSLSTVDSAHANKVRVDGPHYEVGKLPVTMTADIAAAGAGELTAHCHGKREGSVPVEIQPMEDKKYDISFQTPQTDEYILSVLFSEEHVPGSPYKINTIPPDASKVVVVEPENASLYSRPPFKVDTSNAGVGKLMGRCVGRHVGEVPVSVEETEPDAYAVKFDSPRPDIYLVNILWADVDVPGSPFEMNLYPTDASRVKITKPDSYSLPSLQFKADTSEAGKGKLAATCQGRKTGAAPVAVKETEPYSFSIDIENLQPDVYSARITYSGEEVQGSPFYINLLPTDASKVVVTAPENSSRAPFKVDTSEAGIGDLTSHCHGKKVGEVPVSVKETAPEVYAINFESSNPDIYTVNILWSGQDVPGSPFELNLYPLDASKVKVTMPLSYSLPSTQFKADASEAGKGELTASCKGKKFGVAPVSVKEVEPYKYAIDVDGLQPDFYTVDVLYAGNGVPGSPFSINLIPTDAGKVSVIAPDSFSVSVRAPFSVDATEAGTGELTAFCRAENSSNLPVEVTKVDSDEELYKVSVTPIKEDKYHLSILWNKRDVPGSPFELNLIPPTYADRVLVGDPLFTAVNEPVVVPVNTTNAGPGKLTASCKGTSAGNVPVEIVETEKGKSVLSFIPAEPDDYSLSILYNDIPVPRSPLPIAAKPVLEQADFIIADAVESSLEFDYMPGGQEPTVARSSDELVLEIGDPLTIDLEVPAPASDEDDLQERSVDATAAGDASGPADISVDKTGDENSYRILFNPTKPDRYTINISFNGSPAPNSPLIVIYKPRYDASKCFIIGLDKVPFSPMINVPIRFGVDASEAGKGDLRVTSEGASGDQPSTITVEEDKDQRSVFHVTYTPTAPGDHNIYLQWVDDMITGSPLMFNVVSESAISGKRVFPFGKPAILHLSADCKAKDVECFAVLEGTNVRSKLKVGKGAAKGNFILSFQPSTPGYYDVFVKLKEHDVAGSPYRIQYAEPPEPSKVRVTMTPTEVAYVNEAVDFTIDTTAAGISDLVLRTNVRKKARDRRKAPDFKIQNTQDGIHTAQFIPIHTAQHHFDILYAGEHVPGSPFALQVRQKPPKVSHILSSDLNLILVGKPVDVYFKLSDEDSPQSISATAVGLVTDDAEVKVQALEAEREYRAHFIPTNPDDYQVEVMHSKRHIEGSPFPIKVVGLGGFEQSKPPEEIENPPVVPARKSINLLLPIDYNSDETIVATIDGPDSDNQAGDVRNDGKGSYSIVFQPEKPGIYLVHAKKGDDVLNGSPFRILVKETRSDASKCFVLEEDQEVFQKMQKFGKPINFRISTNEAGPGTLNITSRGPGKADVRIFDNNNGTYTCEFSPSVAGKYLVDILWDDQHISGSPYELNFKPKKKKVITGLDLDLNNFRVGVPHRFKLHCEEIGTGSLELAIKPPTAAEIKVSKVGGDSYQVQILPLEEGHHELSVSYGGNHIFGSPYTVTFNQKGDASKCRMISSDVEQTEDGRDHVVFIVSVEGAGKGKLTAHVDNPQSGERQNVTIDDVEQYVHKVHFDLGEGSEYQLVIKFDGEHIEGSPFKLLFADEVDASVCQAEGDGLTTSIVDREASFNVLTEGAGEGEVTVSIKAEDGFEVGTQITETAENEYTVKYTPTRSGDYTISVKFADQDITNSPFAMKCYVPLQSTNLIVIDPATEAFVDSNVVFRVRPVEEMNEEGEVEIKARSRKGEVRGEVKKEYDGSYLCSIGLNVAAKYEVKITLNGENITGSPFKIKVTDPPRPENVVAFGPGLSDGYVGQEGNFTIETEKAGTGTMSVRVHGPKSSFKINMRRHPDNDRTILVRYDPKYVGEYKIDITWSEVHVPGSPFTVNIREQTDKEDVEAVIENGLEEREKEVEDQS